MKNWVALEVWSKKKQKKNSTHTQRGWEWEKKRSYDVNTFSNEINIIKKTRLILNIRFGAAHDAADAAYYTQQ